MKSPLPNVHFVDNHLLAPTNPVTINLIGGGGTGCQVLNRLVSMNESLVCLGHPGIYVRLFDDDIVTKANKGRQIFAESEVGLPKAVALINRTNRFIGTNWKAHCCKFDKHCPDQNILRANITISCIDTAKGRFEIASLLQKMDKKTVSNDRPIYWMDFGNTKHAGQVILSTLSKVKQPASKKFNPVPVLPLITKEYKQLLKSVKDDDQPSCSLAEALNKQDLFINPSLAALGGSLLWSMFREGMIHTRGLFLNLKDLRSQPIYIN